MINLMFKIFADMVSFYVINSQIGRKGMKQKRRTLWVSISPWLILGALVILIPLFVFMSLDNISKQKSSTIQLLLEKGDTLITAFEANTRLKTTEGKANFFELQRLLMEMARQPDVDFITVTNEDGLIIADSDPAYIGEVHGRELNLKEVLKSPKPSWRLVPNPEGADTFEVYRPFLFPMPHEKNIHGAFLKKGITPQIIFVGFNIGPFEKARENAKRHTILMASLLFLLGFTGIVTLFFAQGWQSSRLSLSHMRAFSDTLVEHMPLGLVAIDKNGTIISFNRFMEEIMGMPKSAVIGKEASTLPNLPLYDTLISVNRVDETMGGQTDFRSKEGKSVLLEWLAAPLKDEMAGFLGYLLLFRDITEVERLRKETILNQRLASLGNLAAGIAHEIRNPLSSIKGFATYFHERHHDDPQDREMATIIVQEVERLNRVIGQLLDFARPLTLEKKEVLLDKLIRYSLKMIEEQAKNRGISIDYELSEDVPPIQADEDRVKQVLLNLYLNALEAMSPGGTLKVRLDCHERDFVSVSISDTGKGIPERDLGHIFDPYFTTKPGGTGLGLSIAYKIVEAHGGELKVASKIGEGTTFMILLPLN